MLIDHKLLDALTEEAKTSPRLRMNRDLHTDNEDQSQRMLNALEPGTVLPVHRHRFSTETVVMVRGSLREDFYDDHGRIVESFILKAGGECPALQIPVGQWHSVECLESGTILFEAKDGKYVPSGPDDLLNVK